MQLQIFNGEEIGNSSVQKKIEEIHNSWINTLCPPFLNENIEFNVDYDKDEYCVLGSDWFFIYSVDFFDEMVFINFFEAMQTCENLFQRSMEMYMAFKMLARKYKDFLVEADVNQYSLPFYELFLKKGLITKFCEEAPNDSKYRTMQFYMNPNKLLRTKL